MTISLAFAFKVMVFVIFKIWIRDWIKKLHVFQQKRGKEGRRERKEEEKKKGRKKGGKKGM